MARGRFSASDIASAIYMLFLAPFLLMLLLADLVCVLSVPVIFTSGFGNTTMAPAFWSILFLVSLSFLIPGLRRMYYRLPWLEPLVILLLTDSMIIILAYEILNFGYQVVSPVRHFVFILLSIAWLVGGRYLQCTFFARRPIRFAGEEML